jgi:hypothetical protein
MFIPFAAEYRIQRMDQKLLRIAEIVMFAQDQTLVYVKKENKEGTADNRDIDASEGGSQSSQQ